MATLVPDSEPMRDPYRGVVFVLAATAVVGTAVAVVVGAGFGEPPLLDAALLSGLSAASLFGVRRAQVARARIAREGPVEPTVASEQGSVVSARPPSAAPETTGGAGAGPTPQKEPVPTASRLAAARSHFADGLDRWSRTLGTFARRQFGVGLAGALGVVVLARLGFPTARPSATVTVVAAGLCLLGAGLAATAARYFAGVPGAQLPEGSGLTRWARVLVWTLGLLALATCFTGVGQEKIARMLHLAALAVVAAVCIGLLTVRRRPGEDPEAFPLDLPVLAALGGRANPVASVLDAAERQLGIDLRSTWALTVVRRSIEPLVLGLCVLGWLTTSFTVVHVGEQGLAERLGVPLVGPPLGPGLHVHWPWPVERVFRLPVRTVQSLHVGHEGEEEHGPENVLWARQHAANEYTLLLGNGRDLIAIDAVVQFRIRDAREWLYTCQNPAAALRAIAYRAVMRSTVNRTLDEALSENLTALTGRMRAMVQREADALGLGVEIVAFTVGGMHPPVPVAPDYHAVVSAELAKTTAEVDAQVFRNQTVPAAEAEVLTRLDDARANGATSLATAAGQGWSFRTLESQFRAAPGEYFFRRRLETLEGGLANRPFTIVDSRIQRDGGELWLTP
jgi:regulator of protease activity HflC (stomatin/prohibitin superfamily)